jgi:nucleoid-associated protein YgaU
MGTAKEPPKTPGVPDFSNVQSGSSSTAPAPAPQAAPEPRIYTVAKGDSLWKIAQHHYGDGNLWRKIHEANKDTVKNPDLIHPGQKLVIPD